MDKKTMTKMSANMHIHTKKMMGSFYNNAIAAMIRVRMKKFLYIEVYLKGGRFSGKTMYICHQIMELSYMQCARSTLVVGMTVESHKTRGIESLKKILSWYGLSKEWKWSGLTGNGRPTLQRTVNGYIQHIKFIALADLEQAGTEPPFNEVTGKQGFYGIIWDDEMATKSDARADASFDHIDYLQDGIATITATNVRFLDNDKEKYGEEGDDWLQNIIVFHSLNPYGDGNPLNVKFHEIMNDDIDKLMTKGYNLGYRDGEKVSTIVSTTNYLVNEYLNQESRDMLEKMLSEPDYLTAVYGVTGRTKDSYFAPELSYMTARQRDMIGDEYFQPLTMGMDVGTASASTFYLLGHDRRKTVKDEFGYEYPTKIFAKAEYTVDPKKDGISINRFKNLLTHIWRLGYRFPEIKNGIDLYIDGSAGDTIDAIYSLMREMKNEMAAFDLEDWLHIIPQKDKWKTTNNRAERREDFALYVGSDALLVDLNECPAFFKETAKIVNKHTEGKYDHWYDGLTYGFMPIKKYLSTAMAIKASNGRKITEKTTEE